MLFNIDSIDTETCNLVIRFTHIIRHWFTSTS